MNIYKTTNLINGKIYVGKELTLKTEYYGSGILINFAINKYGKENFLKEVIDTASSETELNEKERYWIKLLNTQDRNIGYNIHEGGCGCSEEILKRRTIKGYDGLNEYQRVWVNKTEEEMEKFKKKARIRSIGEKNNMFGKTHTVEAKQIIGEYSRKRNQGSNNSNAKTWEIIDPDGKQYIVTGGIVAFAKEHNISSWTLSEMAKNPHYQPIQGKTVGWQCKFV